MGEQVQAAGPTHGAHSADKQLLICLQAACHAFRNTAVTNCYICPPAGVQVLAAFLKAIGHIIPLMDAEHAFYYTKEVMVVLRREFGTPDEEMKKIVLKVVKQCVGTEGVEPDYIRAEILPDFFKVGWQGRGCRGLGVAAGRRSRLAGTAHGVCGSWRRSSVRRLPGTRVSG